MSRDVCRVEGRVMYKVDTTLREAVMGKKKKT